MKYQVLAAASGGNIHGTSSHTRNDMSVHGIIPLNSSTPLIQNRTTRPNRQLNIQQKLQQQIYSESGSNGVGGSNTSNYSSMDHSATGGPTSNASSDSGRIGGKGLGSRINKSEFVHSVQKNAISQVRRIVPGTPANMTIMGSVPSIINPPTRSVIREVGDTVTNPPNSSKRYHNATQPQTYNRADTAVTNYEGPAFRTEMQHKGFDMPGSSYQGSSHHSQIQNIPQRAQVNSSLPLSHNVTTRNPSNRAQKSNTVVYHNMRPEHNPNELLSYGFQYSNTNRSNKRPITDANPNFNGNLNEHDDMMIISHGPTSVNVAVGGSTNRNEGPPPPKSRRIGLGVNTSVTDTAVPNAGSSRATHTDNSGAVPRNPNFPIIQANATDPGYKPHETNSSRNIAQASPFKRMYRRSSNTGTLLHNSYQQAPKANTPSTASSLASRRLGAGTAGTIRPPPTTPVPERNRYR